MTDPPSSDLSWGVGNDGELGNGTTTSAQETPVTVALPAGVTATTDIAAGSQNGYAIGSDGNVYSWGSGYTGQLGNGSTTTTESTPVAVSLPQGVTATAIASGGETAYAIGSDGNLYAWGYGGNGELGNGTTTNRQTTPVAVSLPMGVTATAIASGLESAYAIGSDGNLYAWGYGTNGELGNGTTTTTQPTPVAVSLPMGVTANAIAAGSQSGYAIGSDGNVYAWGDGFRGQLGNGTTATTQPTPVKVSIPEGVTAVTIAAGNETGYAIGSDGNIYTWGYGGDGELGNGTTTTAQPMPVTASLPMGVTATAIAAGSYTGYAIGSDSNVYAWGYGANGQLGNGTTTSAQQTLVTVSLPTGVVPTALGPENQSETGYVVVHPVGPQVTITTTSLPDGTLDQPYSFQLEATGGTPPYTWNKYPPKGHGVLPAWLHLSRTGLLSGTPKRSGTYTFTVKCLDSTHSHKTQGVQELTLTINP